MRGIFLIVIFTIFCTKYAVSGESKVSDEPIHALDIKDLKGIADIWNNIKNSIKNAWNSVKDIAQGIKTKINAWITAVKNKATDIAKEFEEKVKKLREKSRIMLENIIGDNELMKECFQKENTVIDNLLTQLIKDVTVCIVDSMRTVSRLDGYHYKLELNETKFLEETERKVNDCKKEQNVEECLMKVRNHLFVTMENTTNEMLTVQEESRGIVDDLLNAVTTCSIEGLIEAASVIATEAVNIINCIKEG